MSIEESPKVPPITEAVEKKKDGLTVGEYIKFITAVEGTRTNLAIFDPGAGIRRQQELYPLMERLNTAMQEELGTFPPPNDAVLGPKSIEAFKVILDFVEQEELLHPADIQKARMLVG